MLKRITPPLFPPRRWSLAGLPDSGKSTFAAIMRSPLVIVDADHRFEEIVRLCQVEAYDLGIPPGDYSNAGLVAAALDAAMGTTAVGTVVVDSLTAIIAPAVAKAMDDKAAGRIKSLAAGMVGKAIAMRLLQSAITKWNTDTLWVHHLNQGYDNSGNKTLKSFISKTELDRLQRSLNLCLTATAGKTTHTISVTWVRWGRTATLTDISGYWHKMPERIEVAVYAPRAFTSSTHSCEFAVQAGVLETLGQARQLYDATKGRVKPGNAIEMATAWREALDKYLVAGPPAEALDAPTEALDTQPEESLPDEE